MLQYAVCSLCLCNCNSLLFIFDSNFFSFKSDLPNLESGVESKFPYLELGVESSTFLDLLHFFKCQVRKTKGEVDGRKWEGIERDNHVEVRLRK